MWETRSLVSNIGERESLILHTLKIKLMYCISHKKKILCFLFLIKKIISNYYEIFNVGYFNSAERSQLAYIT